MSQEPQIIQTFKSIRDWHAACTIFVCVPSLWHSSAAASAGLLRPDERLPRAVDLKHFQRRKAQFLRWLRDFWSTAAFCSGQVIWKVAFRYILFNKPYGVLSQFSGEGETLRQFIPVKNVYPVGRLDHDSEGLLLLTDDGALQHRLSNPKFAHPRTYWAQVERIPDKAALARLEHGIVIREYRTRPAQVRLLEHEPPLPPRNPPIRFRKNVPTAWVEMILTEGRNRQVRRMTAAVGHPTLRLVRAAIGDLTIGNMLPGEWRELTAGELQLCFHL